MDKKKALFSIAGAPIEREEEKEELGKGRKRDEKAEEKS